ncbi:MAG: dTDP-glucose 4,6-dehydratase [Muribaculaceae bacterium]|jgi:dTDP-glucose 4,6-dehydratase|nr:dTDP-glucose 4,6-dehydratase [Muribaculaceae bacterium]MEE1337433.1 dTDP-glucose 4,6-dehydratase [Muribaculaceae bacterium]
MTYLVTGAAGFIGANYVKYLLKIYSNNVNIIILDVLTYAGNLLTIKEELTLPNVTFVKGDISDRDLVTKILSENDVDYIVNFAAESHVDRSITNPKLFLETNILGTHNMLECARQAWFTGKDANGKATYKPGKKFLQISTDEVYGSLEKDYDTAKPLEVTPEIRQVIGNRTDMKTFGDNYFTEETPLSPRSPYSSSKTSADLIANAYFHTYDFPINITRCSNNYGPYHFPEKLIPLIIKNILEGKKLPVYGKGENVRDWLYVEDHAKGIDMVLHKGRLGEVYNIGGFNEESNINIVKLVISLIAQAMNDEPKYQALLKCNLSDINDNLIEYVADRPGHDMRYAMDPTKIATELGWYPETTFKEGIKKTILWYLDNQEWVESVTSGDYQKYYDEMYSKR